MFQLQRCAIGKRWGWLAAKKNPENGYRIYTVSDLMTISDILFYKNLGIPLKKIRDMEKMDLQAHQDLCVQQAKTIRQQQLALEQRMKKLQFHIEALEMICKLQERPYTEEKVDADCIVPFELIRNRETEKNIFKTHTFIREFNILLVWNRNREAECYVQP